MRLPTLAILTMTLAACASAPPAQRPAAGTTQTFSARPANGAVHVPIVVGTATPVVTEGAHGTLVSDAPR